MLEAVKVVFLIFFKVVIFLCSVIEERQEEAGSGACSVCKGGAERKAPLRSLNCMTFIQTERVCVCVLISRNSSCHLVCSLAAARLCFTTRSRAHTNHINALLMRIMNA